MNWGSELVQQQMMKAFQMMQSQASKNSSTEFVNSLIEDKMLQKKVRRVSKAQAKADPDKAKGATEAKDAAEAKGPAKA